jgi:DNA-binding response OmpR family regulator
MMAGEPLANILVVDDSEAVCKALRDVLTMAGYAVRAAPSGERALQILETARMDLVITDLKMSGISGIQLLKRIKDKSPATPVVILTGFGDMDSVIEAMRAGVADYLKKPFSVNEVLQVTARELAKSRQAQAQVAVAAPSAGAVVSPAPKPSRRFTFSSKESARIDAALSELRAQTTAESVLILEDTGHLVSSKGMLNNTDLPSLAALVVGSRKTTTQLASLLGEQASFTLNYLEGQRVGVYAAGISHGLILVVIVPKAVKQGTVLVYAKKAATELEQVVAGASVQAEAAPAPVPSEPSAPAPASEPQPEPAPAQPQPQSHPQPTTNLDLLFSEEALAAGTDLSDSVQTLSWEEAMARGLLGDMKL